jgi:hypothetical protein
MASIYLSGAAIARLTLAPHRMTINRAMRAGDLGTLLERRLGPERVVRYAALDAVERHTGQRFTPDQIAVAVAGHPDRMIIVPQEEVA